MLGSWVRAPGGSQRRFFNRLFYLWKKKLHLCKGLFVGEISFLLFFCQLLVKTGLRSGCCKEKSLQKIACHYNMR